MKITDDHLLDVAKQEPLPGGSALPIRRLLVIHFTSGKSAQSSIDFWRSAEAKGACAHIIIDRDGTIFQCRPFNRTAGHTGPSKWYDPAAKVTRGGGGATCNAFSIGIELANAGDSVEVTGANPALLRVDAPGLVHFGKFPIAAAIKARHKNGGPVTFWEVFPDAQLASCFDLARALFDRYHLDDVRGHDDIAPERKNDPGPAFPMDKLREKLGLPKE
jgi:N-acetylmuramoyl-L-alanine amidase